MEIGNTLLEKSFQGGGWEIFAGSKEPQPPKKPFSRYDKSIASEGDGIGILGQLVFGGRPWNFHE